jgi:hypothetical protein
VQSLDDTPEVYKLKQTKDVVLRREIIRYLKKDVKPPEWTLATMPDAVRPEELQFLSMFDLSLIDNFTFLQKNISYKKPNTLKFRLASLRQPGQSSQQDIPMEALELQGQNSQQYIPMEVLELQGQSDQQDIPMEVPTVQKRSPLQSYQETLLATLNDSVRFHNPVGRCLLM